MKKDEKKAERQVGITINTLSMWASSSTSKMSRMYLPLRYYTLKLNRDFTR